MNTQNTAPAQPRQQLSVWQKIDLARHMATQARIRGDMRAWRLLLTRVCALRAGRTA